MSSTSPSKEPEVDAEAQSGEDHDQQMDKEQDLQGQGHPDFEVKEQDRWLPIANGELRFLAAYSCPDLRVPGLCIYILIPLPLVPSSCATISTVRQLLLVAIWENDSHYGYLSDKVVHHLCLPRSCSWSLIPPIFDMRPETRVMIC
jgi:hypothetical protein